MPRCGMLFDLDCTLTDRQASLRIFATRFVQRFHHQLKPTSRSASIVQELINAVDKAGYAPRSDVCAALLESLAWNHPPECKQLNEFWRTIFPECTVPQIAARDTLASLKKERFRLGIVSNGSAFSQRRKIALLDVADLMDVVVISSEVGFRKPQPAIFEVALNALAATAEEMWFVGDHPLNDIDAARNHGMKTIWVSGSHMWPAGLSAPDHAIARLAELPPIVCPSMAGG